MAPHDEAVEWALGTLGEVIDTTRAREVWQAARDAQSPPGGEVWVHGDLLPGNIVVAEDRLAGVIDWSATGVGDRACDAMFAWCLGPEDRARFRRLLGFDDATWARARGWVVEQTVLYIPYYRGRCRWRRPRPDATGGRAHRRALSVVVSGTAGTSGVVRSVNRGPSSAGASP